jgi:cold shock CspA family protein
MATPAAAASPASPPASDDTVDSVRRQHERDLQALRDEYTARVQGFAGEVLSHYVSGASWEAAFSDFFAEHCHKFASFSVDDSFELRMTDVHHSFLATLDTLLDSQLARLSISAERCLQLLQGSGSASDGAALSTVRHRLEEYADFLTFGSMMRQRHEARTAAALAANGSAGSGSAAGGSAADDARSPTGRPPLRHTRVLWDLENVGVPARLDAFDAVRALEDWLGSRGWWGRGVDGMIAAFFDPDAVASRVRKALDRAGVEQILASSKREDADRKLVSRLERELSLLPAGDETVVVLVTADTDFVAQLRRLKARGGPAVLLTTAPDGSDSRKALDLAATEVHAWVSVLAGAAAAPPAAAASPEPLGCEPSVVEAGEPPASRTSRSFVRGARYEGHCEFWNARGGWGRLCVHGPPGGKIFVHNTALRDGFARRKGMQMKGVRVTFSAGSNAKGPMALEVDLVTSASAPAADM